MGRPAPPSVNFPSSSGKSKKPKRPPGPASGTYVAGRLLAGSGRAWRQYYSLIEQRAQQVLGNKGWAPWLLAQLMSENPNGPRGNVRSLTDESAQDIIQSGGNVPSGATSILQGATGGSPLPLPPALPGPGAAGRAQRAAKEAIYNQWATIDKNGKLVGSTAALPPSNTIHQNLIPLTMSQFNNRWQQLNSMYIAYTGRAATAKQVATVLNSGIDLKYTLPKQLMLQPGFRKSPVWQATVGAYQEAWFRTYGRNERPDWQAIQKAMANRQSPTDFLYSLKYRTDYVRSETYLSNSAQLAKEYDAIYGRSQGDPNAQNLIHQAVLAGWDPDQFAAYLRSQPGYTSSGEYQSKLISFLSGLGLVTGAEPTLQPGQAPPIGGKPLAGPPGDPRIPRANSPTATGPLAGMTAEVTGGFEQAANPGAPGGQ